MSDKYKGKFKIGDRVRCIATDPTAVNSVKLLVLNNLYTVSNLCSSINNYNFISVNSDSGVAVEGIYETWFELVKEKENIIIHCPTQELWDRVTKKLNSRMNNNWGWDKEDTCINVKKDSFANIDWYKKEYPNTPIVEASEWLGDSKGKYLPQSSVVQLGRFYGESIFMNSQGDKEYEEKIIKRFQEYFNLKSNINQPKQKTLMSKALDFIKNATLSSDEKLLRKYEMKDEDGDYTEVMKSAVVELEAKALGFKKAEDFNIKYGFSGDSSALSPFEFHALVIKHLPTIIENLKALKAEEKTDCCE